MTRRRPPPVAFVHDSFTPRGMRPFSSSSSSSPDDWRKQQLQKIQRQFQDTDEQQQQQNNSNNIQSDEDLQPMWKELEGRVTRRKPRTVQQMGGRTGRVNVRPTDEEVWAQEGLYHNNNNNDQHTESDNNNKEATRSSDRDSNEKESK